MDHSKLYRGTIKIINKLNHKQKKMLLKAEINVTKNTILNKRQYEVGDVIWTTDLICPK